MGLDEMLKMWNIMKNYKKITLKNHQVFHLFFYGYKIKLPNQLIFATHKENSNLTEL